MNGKIFKTVWSIFSTAALMVGIFVVLYLSQDYGTDYVVDAVIGILFSFLLAPAFHEIGHLAFGYLTDMEFVYIKFFCFEVKKINGELTPAIVSPFLPDQTQMIPKMGGDMQKRAIYYTLGGLIFSGILLALIVILAIILAFFVDVNFLLWGLVPYMGYLLLLNLAPCEYDSGKTDMGIYFGIKEKGGAEVTMLSAMEIQGRLFEGKSYAEIDEDLFLNVPQLCEDEPLFAVMLDLRYRYYLEKEDFRMAGDCLNRLAAAQEYLPQEEVQKLAGEFVYMHAIKGNIELAKESEKSCGEYLKLADTATKMRILGAYKKAQGLDEQVAQLLEEAEVALEKEMVKGQAKHERILLARIK